MDKNLTESKNRIDFLVREINRHNHLYYILDHPEISDYDFDQLLNELIMLEAQYPQFKQPDSPTQRVGGDITKKFETAEHVVPMQSLGNTYSED